MTLARLKSVAGVRIPDTALCIAAVDLLESSSPKFLCTHCLRTYIFGSLAVRSLGRPLADEEAAFCAALLHDLVATIGLKSMARMLRAISARSIRCRRSVRIWFGRRSLCTPLREYRPGWRAR